MDFLGCFDSWLSGWMTFVASKSGCLATSPDLLSFVIAWALLGGPSFTAWSKGQTDGMCEEETLMKNRLLGTREAHQRTLFKRCRRVWLYSHSPS